MRSPCDVLAAGTIDVYFYGELHGAECASLTAHLKGCAECRQALDDLRLIRAALDSCEQVSAPPGGDWSALMAGLDAKLPAARAGGAPDHVRPAAETPRRHRMTPYFAMAALLALVTMGVLTVVRAPSEPAVDSGPGAAPSRVRDAGPADPDPALGSLSRQHFQRSKLVVLGLATRDAARPADAEWVYERDLAGTLLSDTLVYRMAAEERGMHALAGVMRDLELVLLQTSMSHEPDAAALHQLQQLIRRRDLLTKMNALDTGGL